MKNYINKRKVLIIFCFAIISLLYICLQNNWIKVEHIEVRISNLPKGLTGLKIAQISDVHLPKNASTVSNLIKIVKKEKPDIIVMTGDIIDSSFSFTNSSLSKLCKGLSTIAVTYAVSGNHEVWSNHLEDWKEILKKNNIKIVENKFEIYEKNNDELAIIGLEDNTEYSKEYSENIQVIKDMPKILLAHRPELFTSYSSDAFDIKPDLVFSGHAHGGQFRIPFINKGIIAPDQGLFPKYTSGLYTSASKGKHNGVQMIVSRGLGNSIIPIRINNRPELPIIILK
ncbi:MAG TPA: metallophosphoesterase [Clostridiaceae bacterium]